MLHHYTFFRIPCTKNPLTKPLKLFTMLFIIYFETSTLSVPLRFCRPTVTFSLLDVYQISGGLWNNSFLLLAKKLSLLLILAELTIMMPVNLVSLHSASSFLWNEICEADHTWTKIYYSFSFHVVGRIHVACSFYKLVSIQNLFEVRNKASSNFMFIFYSCQWAGFWSLFIFRSCATHVIYLPSFISKEREVKVS